MRTVGITLAVASMMLLLGACGNNGNKNNGVSGGDNFINSVRAVIKNDTSDSTEPKTLDNFADPTSSDSAEPQAL